jgi:prophage maintenance system killer protein
MDNTVLAPMTWYPSVEDIIDANITVLDIGGDKHPHRLLLRAEAIQGVIDRIAEAEGRGLVYQGAFLMKELVNLHAFDGGNHRTAYLVTKMFLRRNGERLRIEHLDRAYLFISQIETKTVEQIQEWIEHGEGEGP